jgi:metallo-beta-lactamase family protein
VRASIHTLGGFSGHAGQDDLLRWFASLAPAKPRLYLTHGEDNARQALARMIDEKFQVKAACPGLGEIIDC